MMLMQGALRSKQAVIKGETEFINVENKTKTKFSCSFIALLT